MNRALTLYKALKELPRANLGTLPTPLHELSSFEKKMSHNSLWIKRDDLTGLAFGGNKTRNLEFLLGDALSKKCDTIIVSGPVQSNLCSITAAAANKLGLRCIQIFNNNKPSKLTGNSLLNKLLGAESHYIGKTDLKSQTEYMEKLAKNIEDKGNKPYIIYNGSSTPLGALGYVNAALEIYEQILINKINIKNIVIGAGYGGTAAGLIFGSGILGIPFHIHVASVEFDRERLMKALWDLIEGIEQLLNISLDVEISKIMTLYDDYRGKGWGSSTEESDNMVYIFPQMEGFFIEKIYTSKPLVGMVDLLERKILPKDEGVCYWHTGRLPALFA